LYVFLSDYVSLVRNLFELTRINVLLRIGCCKKSATDCVDRPITRRQ